MPLKSMLRADLLEQIPHIAAQAIECSSKVSVLKNIVSEYLIPFVVRNLGSSDTAVDKAAHATLIHLIEQGFITKQQAEIQVCPSILALSKVESVADINTGAVALMGKLASLLGRDVTERIFLKRFSELCASHMFYIRKVCAAHFGEFSAVVGKETFEKVLLPCYITLCGDDIWGVRKACAEVVVFVSCACPPESRKLILAPAFAKLLQDDCRWVKMSAYQTLGPFISTFADPTITTVGYNKGGELVLVNRDEDVDVIINPLTIDTSEFDITEGVELNLKNEEVKVILPEEKIKVDENINLEEPILPITDEREIDEFLKEVVETVKNAVLSCRTVEIEQGVIGNRKSKDKNATNINDVNVITVNSKLCDNFSGSIDDQLTVDMKHLNLSSNQLDTEINSTDKGDACTSSVESREEIASAADGSDKESTDSNKKVNLINIESGPKEDDDLRLFNSYNFWYISPDLPLDPSIIADVQLPIERNDCGDPTSRLEDIYSTINLSDSLDETVPNEDSTLSIENRSNLSSNTSNTEQKNTQPEQDVVPQLLIDHFISMTDPNLALNIDSDLTYRCAFSLPAVALTLGSNNWHLLKNTVDRLASDRQYKVRRTVASGLHELALILGPEIATNNLTPLFDVHPKRSSYLPRLSEFLETDNEWNWRFREELANQLLLAVTLFKVAETAKHIGLVARCLLSDKVAVVRQVALSLVTEIVRYTSSDPGLTANLLVKLAACFAHSKKWIRRQTFTLLCSELLKEQALPPEQFASEVLPHLSDLSWDPVANVRLVVARCLARHVITNEYFANPNNEYYDDLEKTLRRLQADKDRDVRQCAEA
ncbi:hypothetical protein NQ318_009671 [Aromia moschata]|uniref:Serine/threonine-protein phosphatase 4 regulatory subunit 1 n=1 Tax=Aromia moschata TaxID=1265417 RepID=A0AAV8XPD8_9CUCU|nr:hypothetical protein NQ318_009671 [Aromia moschata]